MRTVEPASAEPSLQIRAARRDWIQYLLLGVVWLVFAIVQVLRGPTALTLGYVVVGCAYLFLVRWLRTVGVDLTPGFAEVRGLRRRRVAWRDVQAVTRHRWLGDWRVRLVLGNGTTVRLRAPATLFGSGGAQFEREFNVIGQWWLAHRGES